MLKTSKNSESTTKLEKSGVVVSSDSDGDSGNDSGHDNKYSSGSSK